METTEIQEVSVIETALAKANLTKQIIAKLKADYTGLKINGLDDKEGFKKVEDARKDVKAHRVLGVKICKAGREEAIQIQKDWITAEKDLVAQLDEIETPLENESNRIKEEEKKILFEAAQKAKLPIRKEKLLSIEIEVEDSELLKINDEQFTALFNDLNEKRLAELKAKLEAEQEALDKIKREEEQRIAAVKAEEKRQADLKQAAEKASIDAEAKLKSEMERKEREAKEAVERAEKAKKEAEEQASMAASKAEAEKQAALIKAENDKKEAIAELERKQINEKINGFVKRLLADGYEKVGDTFHKGIKDSGLVPHSINVNRLGSFTEIEFTERLNEVNESLKIKQSEIDAEAELSKGDLEKFSDLIVSLTSLKTKYTFKSAKYKKLHGSVNTLIDKIIDYSVNK